MDDSCKIKGATCMDEDMLNAYNNILETAKKNPVLGGMLPLSKNDISTMEKALNQYKIDCQTCATNGKNDINCMNYAKINFRRNLPFAAGSIYPWSNYDWDYSSSISNKFSTDALPKSNPSEFRGLYQNGMNVVTALRGFIDIPVPSNNTSINKYDKDSDYPIYKCKDDPACITTERIKRNINQVKPTNDKFMNKKIDGAYSSSYYYKIGSCPRPDIKNMKDCEDKGYKWTPNSISDSGSCSQPRYAFIDNSPKPFFNGSDSKGFIPSIANDINEIMPDKLFNSLLGQSTSGLQIEECPIIENFENNNIYNMIGTIILISIIGIYISKVLIK
jgi:hypothetical protein